jgi:hypothetical protein
MTRRTTMIAIGLLASACDSYCGAPPLPGSEQVDLGIDADLHAVVEISEWYGRGTYELLAVGAEGTVVVWSRGDQWPHRSEGELVVDVFDLGDLDLRAAWIDRVDWPPSVAAWWVVGDGGQIMVSNNRGVSWDEVQLPGEPDLYGIAGFDGRPIVVGDEVIAMRSFDGTWTELVPPADGWGSLRGIFADDTGIDVVGLGGVIWSTSDPNGAWTLEPTGVTADLFAIDEDLAVGAQGTLLRRTETGWAKEGTGYDVDLVDVAGDLVVGDDGAVYVVSHPPIERIQTTTQARAVLDNTGVNAWTTVGDGGWASSPPNRGC